MHPRQETHDSGNRPCRSRTKEQFVSYCRVPLNDKLAPGQVVLGNHAEGICLKRLAERGTGASTCRAARLQGTMFETSEIGDIEFEDSRIILAVETVGTMEVFIGIVGTEVPQVEERSEL
jgi:hypothetical protein